MSEYLSIKKDVLSKIGKHLPEIRQRFGIEKLCLFGSVAREEDTPDSDIDLSYLHKPETYSNMYLSVELTDYLETLLGRKVDLIPLKWAKPHLLKYIERDSLECKEPDTIQ